MNDYALDLVGLLLLGLLFIAQIAIIFATSSLDKPTRVLISAWLWIVFPFAMTLQRNPSSAYVLAGFGTAAFAIIATSIWTRIHLNHTNPRLIQPGLLVMLINLPSFAVAFSALGAGYPTA